MSVTEQHLNNVLACQNAICYSGYRPGQSPGLKIYPSYSQILEDLLILKDRWHYLRLYDSGPHAQLVLEVVKREQLPFKILLGMDLAAEQSNPNCPWGAYFSDEHLADNMKSNDEELQRAVYLLRHYAKQLCGVSVGNEASVDWTDHKVSTERLVFFAKHLKSLNACPVTFCENYVPWANGQLDELAGVVDFISLHSYPVWESVSVDQAMEYTKQNYASVANRFADKQVIITEAGWTSNANGQGFPAEFANEDWQTRYCVELMQWSKQENKLVFLFEAFDEAWKGSGDPLEPEKHWGIYKEDRTAKAVVEKLL